MKPAGIERDKQIAEIRGDDIKREYIGRVSYYCGEDDYPPCESCHMGAVECDGKRIFKLKKPKPYSTDISCAMELWEEMKGAAYDVELSWLASVKREVVCIVGYNKGEWINHAGETEADAISGAWIKWREHETVQR